MPVSRRAFITWTAAGGLVLALGPASGRAAAAELSPWIRIAPDGKVTLISTVSEMGQGSRTGQIQVLADELDVPWEAVAFEMALDREPFRLDGRLYSGGSSSIRSRFHLLRRAGASVRAQLTAAAAARWGVPAADCRSELGRIAHAASGRNATYGELAAAAATIPAPADPPLKDPGEWRYIGKGIATLGLPGKADGTVRYGIDVRLPGMKRATIRQSPTYGGSLVSVDEVPAMAIPGFVKVVRLPGAVAVVADDTWAAFKASQALKPQWSAPAGGLTSSDLRARLLAALDAGDANLTALGDGQPGEVRARLRAAYAAAIRKVEATYEVPYLSHSPLEPMNATAEVGPDQVRIWAPTQNITTLRNEVARALGRPVEAVEVEVTWLGGGFGRRLKVDYAIQAALIAREVGGPVQLVWRREEDLAHDFYRPASLNRFRAALGEDGLIGGYEIVGATTNDTADGGAEPAPYRLADYANSQSEVKAGVPIGAWRSVDASITVFGKESFIDECAHAATRDPLDYRRALLGRNARARRVLDAAAEGIDYGRKRPSGSGVGLALFHGWESLVAHAVEVETRGRALKVTRIVVAADCGTAVNPDQVRAQCEGGSLFALSAALGEEMTFTGGAADQTNFDSYPLLRMRQAPDVQVVILESPRSAIGGMGEPPVPGLAPALANAVFAASGERVRRLPFSASGWSV